MLRAATSRQRGNLCDSSRWKRVSAGEHDEKPGEAVVTCVPERSRFQAKVTPVNARTC